MAIVSQNTYDFALKPGEIWNFAPKVWRSWKSEKQSIREIQITLRGGSKWLEKI
jgi:hypothetical protein